MDIDFLLLADGAHVAGDKLYVLGGGWTVIWARQFPVEHSATIALGMMVDWNETNEKHQIEGVLLSDDGQVIDDPLFRGDFEIGKPPGIPPGTAQRFMAAVPVTFRLEKEGGYVVSFRVDGTELRRSVFTAVQRPARA